MDGEAPTLAERLRGRRVGVALSAGYFGFFGHAGFLAALDEVGVRPECWAGTSAGALVAAMAASGRTSAEVLARLAEVRKADFWDPDPLGVFAGGHGATGVLKGERFRSHLERELPARFEDLAAPCVVVATNLSKNGARAFQAGPLAPAVHASCAYPGLFRAVEIEGDLYWDGGLADKAPVLALHRAQRPETILVHYLPTRDGGAPVGLVAYPRAMAGAVAALRHDHFLLQVQLVRALGVDVVVLTTALPRLGPGKLAQGLEVAAEAKRKVLESLGSSAAIGERELWR